MKETVYLAGKITGDPLYRSKFYAAACFLPDWTESRGATWEFGRAAATGKRVFMFAAWKAERDTKGGGHAEE